jgi:hypothetical protein
MPVAVRVAATHSNIRNFEEATAPKPLKFHYRPAMSTRIFCSVESLLEQDMILAKMAAALANGNGNFHS